MGSPRVRSADHSKHVVVGQAWPRSASITEAKPKRSITLEKAWLILRRTLILIAAIIYLRNSMEGGIHARNILVGIVDNTVQFSPYQASYINKFMTVAQGDTPVVGKGKLVSQILNGDTTPLANGTLYLHSADKASFDECPNWTISAKTMYNDVFLRDLITNTTIDIAYAVPELVGTEMIVPVVDCSFTAIQIGDKAVIRAFYLMRKSNSMDVNDTFLITFSLSVQDYMFPDQYEVGPTGLLVLSIVSDFSLDNVTHYYALTPGYPFEPPEFTAFQRTGLTKKGYMILQSIPTTATIGRPPKIYHTAFRTGIFRSTEAEQGQIKNLHWDPSATPALALSQMNWKGVSIRCDSWAWVYCIHFYFVAETSFNILILLQLVIRNKMKGKIWIGDAFVSISTAASFRAVLIIIAWALNGFWTLHKFQLEEGNVLGNVTTLFIYSELMHADLMIIYLGIVNILGMIVRERIDPALSILLFELGFAYRRSIAVWFPSLVNKVVAFARADYADGMEFVDPDLATISPLRFGTTHELTTVPSNIVAAALFPIFFTMIVLVVYIPMRKVFHHYVPESTRNSSRGSSKNSRVSVESDSSTGLPSNLTVFEVATGAALRDQFGLVADYQNCIYIKGMKFASADGIYSNGYIVANNKFLLRTNELGLILLMVLTRVRFTDIYVYQIDGYTVHNTARIFYPEMLKLSDLFNLHTMILT